MDNNAAERLLRTSVVGRKNFYGSGSYSSGDLAKCAYTVLLTAAQNGLNPLTYLRAYLDACAANGGQAPRILSIFSRGKPARKTWLPGNVHRKQGARKHCDQALKVKQALPVNSSCSYSYFENL